MSRTVAEVMTAPALTATAEESLSAAAARMATAGVGSVVVVEGNRPVGILTERDLLSAAAAAVDPSGALVASWMTPDPECLQADASIDDAWNRLGERGYRHIPVVAGGEFKGIVSMRDLVALAQIRPAAEPAFVAPPGLKGFVVAETSLGDVRGTEGFFHYRQYAATDLAAECSFEEVMHLMLDGALPSTSELESFRVEIATHRDMPQLVATVLPTIAGSARPVDTLRTALACLGGISDLKPSLRAEPGALRDAGVRFVGCAPTIVAAIHRLRNGHGPVAPDPDLGLAANYLYMLHGAPAPAAHVRALEQYLILALDHGFNASTFTSRVVTSTGADLGAALVAALGALSGPLHGGAIDRALETLDAIATADCAAAWVYDALQRGETIMGFGHPVYRTADPRSTMLRGIAESLGGERAALARRVEIAVEEALAELKPGRELHTNIEWYAAVVLEHCGIPRDLFTPTFALTRMVGWCAHAAEQAADNRIIRPSARYVGPPAPQALPR